MENKPIIPIKAYKSTIHREDQPVAKQTSVGKCNLCGRTSGEGSITSHLGVPACARLFDLDEILTRTWLECCGHLSAFTIGGTTYSSDRSDDAVDQDFDKEEFENEDLPDEDEDEDAEDEEDEEEDDEEAEEFEEENCNNRSLRILDSIVNHNAGNKSLNVRLTNILRPELRPVVNSPRVAVSGYTG